MLSRRCWRCPSLERWPRRHVLNATEDVSNFFSESPHLSYHRVPIKDRSDAEAEMEAHFQSCVLFIDS